MRSSLLQGAVLALAGMSQAGAALLDVRLEGPVAGEGDRLLLHAERGAGAPGRVELRGDGWLRGRVLAAWGASEFGVRETRIALEDDLVDGGDTRVRLELREFVDGVAGDAHTLEVEVLDNDGGDRPVLRVLDADALPAAFASAAAAERAALVLDAGPRYVVPIASWATDAIVAGDLEIHGNRAWLQLDTEASDEAAFEVAASGRLGIDNLDVAMHSLDRYGRGRPLLENRGQTRLARGQFIGPGSLRNRGRLEIERAGVSMGIAGPSGQATARSSTLATSFAGGEGSLDLLGSTLAAYYPLAHDVRPGQLTASGSYVVERVGSLFPEPPEFHRPPCASPLITGLGGNLFTAGYVGGDGREFGSSGCASLSATDRFDPEALLTYLDDAGAAGLEILYAPWLPSPAVDLADPAICPPFDQRGAPRPQSSEGTPPRCDAGAYEVGINPYRGIWSGSRANQGFDLQTVGNRLAFVWYTYDGDGEPTAYQAVAPLEGPHWSADLMQPRRDPAGGAVRLVRVGQVQLDFAGNAEAALQWRFAERGTEGTDNLHATLFMPGLPRMETTGLWYDPLDPGYGATVARRGTVTVLAVYYYDAEGAVRWAFGTTGDADAASVEMQSFRGACPDCTAPMLPAVREAGSVTAHFQTPRRARFDIELRHPGAGGGTWLRRRAILRPLSDAVDNRDALRPPYE